MTNPETTAANSNVEIMVDGKVVAAASVDLDRHRNAGVNMLPELLRKLADQIEEYSP